MYQKNDERCRLCLAYAADMEPLLGEGSESKLLLSVVQDIVRIDISHEDEFSKMVCESCAEKLKSIAAYVKLFQETDRKLRRTEPIELENEDESTNPKTEHLDNDAKEVLCTKSQEPLKKPAARFSEINNYPIEQLDSYLADEEVPTVELARPIESRENRSCRRSERVPEKRETMVASPSSNVSDQSSDVEFNSHNGEADETSQTAESDSAEGKVKLKEKTSKKTMSLKHRQKRKPLAQTTESAQPRKAGTAPMLHDFKCYICNSESLGSKKALIEHLACHVDKIPHTCERCVMETIVLTRVRTLNTHMKMHEQPVKCDYCDRRYSNAAGKYYHTQTYHLGGGAPCLVNCDICGKQCGSKVALKQHMKYHTTALKCSQCDLVFNHANKRRKHEQTHHEQGGYECIVCKKVLQSIESYDVHLKKHSQERSYQCTLCPKKFNTSSNLILHLKVHAKNYNYRPARSWVEHYTIVSRNPMQYKCNHCERYGTDKVNNMISHLQAHFKEHQCDRCKRLFATAKQLRAHYTTYTGEKSEMCQHCGKCFSTKNSLRIHLKTHSRMDEGDRMSKSCNTEPPVAMAEQGS